MSETRIFFTTQEVTDRWRMSPRTLEGWRDKGIGPSWVNIGSRVRYRVEVIERAEREWSETDIDLS